MISGMIKRLGRGRHQRVPWLRLRSPCSAAAGRATPAMHVTEGTSCSLESARSCVVSGPRSGAVRSDGATRCCRRTPRGLVRAPPSATTTGSATPPAAVAASGSVAPAQASSPLWEAGGRCAPSPAVGWSLRDARWRSRQPPTLGPRRRAAPAGRRPPRHQKSRLRRWAEGRTGCRRCLRAGAGARGALAATVMPWR
jgi:hypothetical protein